MRFVSCVGEELGMADLNFQEQAAIAESLSHLEADHVLIDVGSGTSCSVLDFFNLGTESIVVASPDQVSMQSAYGFVKNSIYRRVQKSAWIPPGRKCSPAPDAPERGCGSGADDDRFLRSGEARSQRAGREYRRDGGCL